MENPFERTIQAIGETAFQRLQEVNIILFGVGGVGGWCAEALVRTGVKHLTIVDFDVVNPSNINRQLVATTMNVGLPKVEELKKRLLLINPELHNIALPLRYPCATLDTLDFNQYDYVIDAIDSVADKALLLTRAVQSSAKVFSSMGAGRKVDTSAIRVSTFNKVEGCPLARALRHTLKKMSCDKSQMTNVTCVWSPELSSNAGTIAPIVGVFGFTLADLVIKDIVQSL